MPQRAASASRLADASSQGGSGASGGGAEQAVGAAVGLAEEEPGGAVRVGERAGVEDVEGAHDVVVVDRLVHEAPPEAVHEDRARQRARPGEEAQLALRVIGARALAREAHGQRPPRLAEVGDGRAALHRHAQRVALVEPRRAEQRVDRAAQPVAAQLRVPLEAARGEHDAPPRLDPQRLAVLLGLQAGDAALRGREQALCAHAALDAHAVREAARDQCARQRAPAGPLAAVEHEPAAGPARAVGQRLAHRLGQIAEGGRVEGRRVQRAAVGGAAGQVGLVVGEGQHAARGVAASGRAEAQRRLRLEEARGFRGGGDEGFEQRRVGAAERDRAQVAERLLRRVRQLQLAHVVVVRQPGDAAGDGGGAAEAVRSLEQQHRAAPRPARPRR